jgi:hypothetical protein
VLGDYVIASCNVGSAIAGTGDEALGDTFTYTEAMDACATGYHVPSANEWLTVLQNGNILGLRSGARNGSTMTRNADALHRFDDALLLPRNATNYQTSTLNGGEVQQFVANTPIAGLIQTTPQEENFLRCFQDRSDPINEGDTGFQGTGTTDEFTSPSCTPYTVPHNGSYLLEVRGARGNYKDGANGAGYNYTGTIYYR